MSWSEPMIGRTISHYQILEKLGEGGMGIVYKAEDTSLKRTVALKFLPPELTRNEASKERFIQEAQAASALQHANICTIHELDETADGRLFIVMDCYEGETLKKKIDRGPLSIEDAIDVAVQTGQGLAKAHDKSIIHRDIKPANIFITTDGVVKILDFGLAKLAGQTLITRTGSTVGTAAYMSPEQVKGEEVDAGTDIWSLGVSLYEMLTAHLPFRGEHQAAVLYSIVNEDPQPMARFNDKIPVELERVVLKALAKDREERYQHADDMLADLRKEQRKLEYARTSTIKQETPAQKVHEKRSALRIIVPLSAIALLAIVLILFNPFKKQAEENSSLETLTKSLAVMYFEDIPDPEDKDHTGDMLVNLLITFLSQVNGLEVISRERLLEIQNEMGHGYAKNLSSSLAEQVAKQAGVTTMLVGSILQERPRLAVTTRLIDVQSGRIISSQEVASFKPDQIFSLVDSLAATIQSGLQVTSASSEEIKPVADVTTKSPEAYRAYVEGLELDGKFYWKDAIAAYSKAIELDSEFAMAYYRLSLAEENVGGTANEWQGPFEKAVSLVNKTAERERMQILAENYRREDNPQKAVEVYEQLIDRYPHEIFPYEALATLYSLWFLEPQKAVGVYRRGLKMEPSSGTLWNELAYAYAYLDKKQEALDAVSNYVDLAPAEPNPYDSKGDIYAAFMEFDSSRSCYEKAVELKADFFSAVELGFDALLRQRYDEAQKYFKASGFSLPVIEAYHGELHRALKKLAELPISRISIPNTGFSDVVKPVSMIDYSYELGRYPEMLLLATRLKTQMSKYPVDRIHWRDYMAWALVKNGKSAEAEKTIDEIEKDINGSTPRLQARADFSSALVSFEEGKHGLALEKFTKVMRILPPNHAPSIFYAIALLKNGQTTKAIDELQRILHWPTSPSLNFFPNTPGTTLYWPVPAVKAHYWLGVAYEKLGEKKKAIEEYQKFVDVWKDADFKSPELADAKARVVALEKVTGK